MSVKKDASGRRSVQLEVEVPGTPEEVWQAVATGPGISSWFVPTDLQEREGGAIAFHLGPGMDSSATVTGWRPPREFAYEERDWSVNAPPLASEWFVETCAGRTCVVRLVHSLFASSEEWDDQLESFESGWPGFFRVLQLYLTHFRGQGCAPFRVMVNAAAPEPKAWENLIDSLGLASAAVGQRRSGLAGAPPFAGTVERIGDEKHAHELVLRLDEPAPGVAVLGAYTWGGQILVSSSIYLYGAGAATSAQHEEFLWRAWMQERFPMVANASVV